MPELTPSQIAELCAGSLEPPPSASASDPSILISGASTIEHASPHQLAFAENAKHAAAAAASHAGCILVPLDFPVSTRHAAVRVSRPREAFAKLLRVLYPEVPPSFTVHSSVVVHQTAILARTVHVDAYVTIGAGTHIANGARIAAGCRIGNNVHIGENCRLHPNVTLYDNVRLGERVIIHAGAVIGADGFGYLFAGDHYEKFPQVGTVEIEDDVEIGANCAIDRAALGVTRIGAGTKLDNLVHVAHNCNLGRHVVVAAQTGFSGSVHVGDYAVIGGQAGIGEKAHIAAKAVVGGKAGVLTGQRVPAGEPVWGIPARPLRQHLKNLAHVSHLPKTQREIDELRKRVDGLSAKNESER